MRTLINKNVSISISISNFYPYYVLPVKRYVVKIIIWISLALLIHIQKLAELSLHLNVLQFDRHDNCLTVVRSLETFGNKITKLTCS